MLIPMTSATHVQLSSLTALKPINVNHHFIRPTMWSRAHDHINMIISVDMLLRVIALMRPLIYDNMIVRVSHEVDV